MLGALCLLRYPFVQIAVCNYNSSYAKVLVMKSPEEMRRNPGAGNPNKPESSKNLPANAFLGVMVQTA